MKTAKRHFLMAATAGLALICSANEVGIPPVVGAQESVLLSGDQLGASADASMATWRRAAGYAPTQYPPQGFWETVLYVASR